MYNIHLLPAMFGDSILIEYGSNTEPRYILIDGGPFFAFNQVIPALKKVAPELKELELLVITHIDIDHIDGIITMLNQPELPFKIKDIWFNGYNQIKDIKDDTLGALQGEYISILIDKHKLPHNKNEVFNGQAVMVSDYKKLPVITLTGGMELTLLSPGKEGLMNLKKRWDKEITEIEKKSTLEDRWKNEKRYSQVISDMLGLDVDKLMKATVSGDKSAGNQSSIAFIAKFEEKSCLFAGDATSDDLLKAINPMLGGNGNKLKLDAWKLAHHGSKKSNLVALMQKIDTKKILVSSDGTRYGHPDPECIAKLLGENKNAGISFYFNYLSEKNKIWNDEALQEKYKYSAIYPQENFGITLAL